RSGRIHADEVTLADVQGHVQGPGEVAQPAGAAVVRVETADLHCAGDVGEEIAQVRVGHVVRQRGQVDRRVGGQEGRADVGGGVMASDDDLGLHRAHADQVRGGVVEREVQRAGEVAQPAGAAVVGVQTAN